MKTSKKILIIFTSILVTALISTGLSAGTSFILSWNFWPIFWLFFAAQILGSLIWDKYYESNQIIAAVKEYASRPYRKYMLAMNCAHCGHKNEIEIDLTDTEFRCSNCQKYNGIHVNFMAAAITEPTDKIEV
jgi:DNA-directed RNA polymerase subunit RPC12/RpoP